VKEGAERVVALNLNHLKATGRDGGVEDRNGTMGLLAKSSHSEGVMENVKSKYPTWRCTRAVNGSSGETLCLAFTSCGKSCTAKRSKTLGPN
jgi:hypothetical protein